MNRKHAPKIIDSTTRVRYQNQRESRQLREKLKDLTGKQHVAMYKNIIDQNRLKHKLYEFCCENGQNDLYDLLTRRSRQSSALSWISGSDISDEDTDVSSTTTTSLLLHNLAASSEYQKSLIQLGFFLPKKPKKLPCYGEIYSRPHSTLQRSVSRSLRHHTERMKTDVKVSIARSARDSRLLARRAANHY